MNLKEYQQQAKRTCPTLGSIKLDLAHMVLGIFSEYNEMFTAIHNGDLVNFKEELGDNYWYIANYCNFRNYDLQGIYETINYDIECNLEDEISKFQDVVKKYIAYNKDIDSRIELELISNILACLESIAKFMQIDSIEECLDRNINKLKVRFPDKFNENAANNRDLEAERKVLEG